MPDLETTISKIQLPDGTVVNLSNNQKLVIPQLAVCNVEWNVRSFTGETSLISGTSNDYLLTVPDSNYEYHDILDELDKTSQTKNGSTLTWDSTNRRYKVDKDPSAATYFYLYRNLSGFPKGLNPGDNIIFGSGSGNSNVVLYIGYSTNGTSYTNLGNSYATATRAIYTLPANSVGMQVFLYVKTGTAFTNVYAYPTVLVPNS